jgi:PhnB protein
MTKRETVFTKDLQNKTLTVVRAFDASLERVWKAWSTSEILEQWWAPRPYKAVTKTMDFREGGLWLYNMMGPQGDNSWCKESYKTIVVNKRIVNDVNFCDEAAHVNADFPTMHWKKEFSEGSGETMVTVEITFDKEADMETIIVMGFKEGFTMGMDNLEEYFSTL